ncbi:GNAT family N-acetyltransferase [Pseudarthrobacter sp. J64]|uniref:GNAT family N-acetyltransferase n=1 Tax=Pseudarthrobacter sp. J64 TaxID=3116485 RepID=UPI002E807589|nr:GNAT family N-acetyltransferase [Pseudarthrobacter sp. J64]MEE2570628.1 GNAT family N-acetyltransferase [Pseudarthrobacter sp. J64]
MLDVITPDVSRLVEVGETLAQWQVDGGPVHLHPGDLGWYSLRGPEETASSMRIWADGATPSAIGLLDGPQLLRLAIDPARRDDTGLAAWIADSVEDPEGGVFAPGRATVEARGAGALTRSLGQKGWHEDEPWIPLSLDLSAPVQPATARIETIGEDRAGDWVSVHWSAFRGTALDDAARQTFINRWLAMTSGPFAPASRHLVAFDQNGEAAAVTTVWSAGAGRPGLIEPMGVHQDHRGRGYGVEITRAGAAVLREMGSSSVVVAAEGSNNGALATYLAAGFVPAAPVADMSRDG